MRIARRASEEQERLQREETIGRELEQKRGEIQEELSTALNLVNEISSATGSSESALHKLEQSVANDCIPRLQEATAFLNAIGTRRDSAQYEKRQYEDKYVHASWNLQRYHDDIKRFRSECCDTVTRREGFQHAINEYQAQYEGLSTRADTLRGQLNTLHDRSASFERELTEVRQAIKRIDNESRSEESSVFEAEQHLSHLRRRLAEELRRKPSAALQSQLRKESEVVLRAEGAVALERQQERIRREAEEMTRLKILQQPRLFIDDEASKVLLEKHLSPEARDEEIAKQVVEMAMYEHIRGNGASNAH